MSDNDYSRGENFTADPEYRRIKDEFENEGGLPPDEAAEDLRRLAEDVRNGRVDDTERKRIALNAISSCKARIISAEMRRMALEAVMADENGNLKKLR